MLMETDSYGTFNKVKDIKTYHHYYINGVVGSFVESIAEFFKSELLPRTKEVVIGTYSKGLQYYKNKLENSDDKFRPSYPFINIDPGLDFEPDDRAGMFFHQYPRFENYFATKVFGPNIYEDDNMIISPVLNRYKGQFEIIMWCSSVYEMIDYRILMFQFFGGLNRPFSPKSVDGYFVLPDSIMYYTYENPYTKETYELDWENTLVKSTTIKNINKNKYIYPFTLDPLLKLVSVSDGFERYENSSDEISESRLNVVIEWESYIPTHLVLYATHLPKFKEYSFSIDFGIEYIRRDTNMFKIPKRKMMSVLTELGTGRLDLIFYREFTYTLTVEDIELLDNDNYVYITLPEGLPSPYPEKYLLVFAKYGELKYKLNWELDNPWTVKLVGAGINNLEIDDTISLIIYRIDHDYTIEPNEEIAISGVNNVSTSISTSGMQSYNID